jgi:TrmH family RNA methyltransferase
MTIIESPQNEKLKAVRKLHIKKHRRATGLFVAEGEDLALAALAAGWEPAELLLTPDAPAELVGHERAQQVAPPALAAASALGSGTRVIGVFEQIWLRPSGDLSVYLDGVADPGNVGTVLRSALAFGDGPVVVGPGCADPYSPKAVRASMGAVFERPPAQASLADFECSTLALDARANVEIEAVDVAPPVVVCVGAERDGLSARTVEGATHSARLTMRPGGPESLNAAVAASIALYTLNRRFGNTIGKETAE